jgi:hypothetical protein
MRVHCHENRKQLYRFNGIEQFIAFLKGEKHPFDIQLIALNNIKKKNKPEKSRKNIFQHRN